MKTIRHAPSKREKARREHQRKPWLPLVWMVTGGFVLAALIFLSFQGAGAQNVQPARVGTRLGDFSLTDLSGQTVQLSDYEGQVVLINAWATWCPPCRAEMPALNAYYQAHAANGFVILAVNAGDTAEDASAFAQDYGLTFPVLLDPNMQVLNGLNIHSFPTSILIGRDGAVKDIHIGMFTSEQIDAKIGAVLEQ